MLSSWATILTLTQSPIFLAFVTPSNLTIPSVCSICNSTLITCTLAEMKTLCGGGEPLQKCPLTEQDLHALYARFNMDQYDDSLFLAILFTAFNALM